MKKYSRIAGFLIVFISFLCFSQTKKTTVDTTKVIKQITEKTVFDTIQRDSLKPVIKPKTTIFKEKVHASYYAEKFHGRKTASGKLFDMNKLTAAHKKLPFGTKLKVTNKANGKFVIVEVNDRGPYVKGRELDLSKKAFSMIANISRGFVVVDIEILK